VTLLRLSKKSASKEHLLVTLEQCKKVHEIQYKDISRQEDTKKLMENSIDKEGLTCISI
jgi:nitrate/TMAO reductase-like tetraheme cytochrome c subunit